MMPRIVPMAALAVLPLLATSALAQTRAGRPDAGYGAVVAAQRSGQPDVMVPAGQIDPTLAQVARFRAAYQSARSPRIVIFWNRALTDDVETERRTTTSLDSRTVSGEMSASAADSSWFGDRAEAAKFGAERTHAELSTSTQRIDTGRRDTPNGEAADFDMERGFNDMLSGAGAQLVDRTMAMRRAALSGSIVNVQAVEMKAILRDAEIVLEVVPISVGAGISYKIVARRIANGQTVAALRSSGRAAERRMPYVAGPSGFVRAVAPPQTAYQTGRQLALEAMTSLTGRL